MAKYISEIISGVLSIDDGTPVFYIIKPHGYECNRFIVFNYSAFPCYHNNDKCAAEEVEYTYHVVFKDENIKEHLKFCKELQEHTLADKVLHYYDDVTKQYHVVYESKPFVNWCDDNED